MWGKRVRRVFPGVTVRVSGHFTVGSCRSTTVEVTTLCSSMLDQSCQNWLPADRNLPASLIYRSVMMTCKLKGCLGVISLTEGDDSAFRSIPFHGPLIPSRYLSANRLSLPSTTPSAYGTLLFFSSPALRNSLIIKYSARFDRVSLAENKPLWRRAVAPMGNIQGRNPHITPFHIRPRNQKTTRRIVNIVRIYSN